MLASDLGKLNHFNYGAQQQENITSQYDIWICATSASEDFHKLLMVRDAKWLW